MTIFARFTMSLDGFVALPDDSVGPLFDWYDNGDVEVPLKGYGLTFKMSEASARFWRETDTEGAFITGRRLFDYAHGWGGRPPGGSPTFVVTHRPPPAHWPPFPDAPFTFVGTLEDALNQARAAAGDGDIGVAGPNIAQQCLRLGVLDEVRVDLAPVLLGDGIRFFDQLDGLQVMLDDPQVVPGTRVVHLRYPVRRA